MIKTKYLLGAFALLTMVISCKGQGNKARAVLEKNEKVDFFADNGYGNAVAVVQHPAGIYHDGITYVCYQGPQEDSYVASYNHETKEWQGPFKVGISEMGKDPTRKKKIDNHGKPSILIDDQGYIHIVFGGHGGMRKHGENLLGNHHYGKNLHAVSKRPLDISSWETLNTISPFGTYNQWIKMDNGDIYLFYRHGAHRSNWVYQLSTDNGRSFSEPISFLKHKRRNDMAAVDSWYPWITKGDGNELHVVFDYHLCLDTKPSTIGLGHIAKRYNVYYMKFNTQTGEWTNINNDILETPVTREIAEAKTLVAETDDNWTFQGVLDLDSKGRPHIGMTVGKEIPNSRRSAPKKMHYFWWDGTQWVQNRNTNMPTGNGFIKVTEADDVQFFIDEVNENGQGAIARYDSRANGTTFKKEKTFIKKSNARFAISASIENAHPDALLIVAEISPKSDYRRMYLLGDNGPIQRKTSEAKVLAAKSAFDHLKNAKEWNLVLSDTGTRNWRENWTLDGELATIENTEAGMNFSAGPEANNDAHHAVLWTKDTFAGDIRIEYDYVRTDEQNKYVNILYIQASGTAKGEYATDIAQWQHLRKVPAMRKYFENMNALHISYAAFGNKGDGLFYTRARRYPKPEVKSFKITQVEPSYDYKGFIETGKKYHITAMKLGDYLYFEVSGEGGSELFTWDLSKTDPILEGRIGLRHMYTRSARYSNFKIYTK